LAKSWLIVPLLVLYLTSLGGAGFLGPDEPRYASIGREMARSGDWVTPRLNGNPWFEKPPLLYWTTALGHRLHLPDEWAARLPVALASLAFLIFFFATMEREFSMRVAAAATAILATSAGWLAYSFVAVPDLQMSAALGAALLVALFDTRPHRGWLAGALLGASILAKGFVPAVLFAPVFLIARGKRLAILAACTVIAAPWYLLCTLRNGAAFWDEFFWKQQAGRFLDPGLEHVQPFWFYLPVIFAGLFPWTPLMGLLARRKTFEDLRVRFLLMYVVFGLLFFSAARNKLPGYVLPLLPALAVVLAVALSRLSDGAASWWMAACVLLLVAIPTVARVLPDALLVGVTRMRPSLAFGLPFVLVAALVWFMAWNQRAPLAMLTAALAAAVAAGYLKNSVFPALDQRVSVRGFWLAHQPQAAQACLEDVSRSWAYGLNYYAGHPLPACGASPASPRIFTSNGRLHLAPGEH
jgi:4-amino-4-deoxy-L-arabinose transferase-like glycosyltransferase